MATQPLSVGQPSPPARVEGTSVVQDVISVPITRIPAKARKPVGLRVLARGRR